MHIYVVCCVSDRNAVFEQLCLAMGTETGKKFQQRIMALSRRSEGFSLTTAEAQDANEAMTPWLTEVKAVMGEWDQHTKPRFVLPQIEAGACSLLLIFSVFPRDDHKGKHDREGYSMNCLSANIV
jgi:hypothetical protein